MNGWQTCEYRVLARAQQVIQDFGWIQGEGGDTEIGFCALGALKIAVCDLWGVAPWQPNSESIGAAMFAQGRGRLAAKLDNAVWTLNGLVGNVDIVQWNDVSGRTQAEVLGLFDQAKQVFWPDK